MATARANQKFTYEHYTQMPEGLRYELLDGDFFRMTPAPTPRHQQISRELQFALEIYLRKTGSGLLFNAPVDVVLSNHDVLQPDIVVISQDRAGIVREKFIGECPDLVVEILSPSTARRDRGVKKRAYARFGARELWLVDPASNQVEVHVLGEDGEFQCWKVFGAPEILRSPLLDGFELKVDGLFA